MMDILTANDEYRTEYTRFVQGMSYATNKVLTYAEAIAKVKALLDHLLKRDAL